MLENKIRDLLNGNVRIQKEFLSGKILFRKYFHRNIMKPFKIHVNMLKIFTSSKSILVTFMMKWEKIPLLFVAQIFGISGRLTGPKN